MRSLFALAMTLALAGSILGCGGGGSPSPIQASPAVRSPSTPLPSPTGGYEQGY